MFDFKSNMFGFDEGFIDPCLCSAWIATAIIGAGVVGAASTAYSASKASDAQVSAANTAAQTQLSMYNTTRGDLSPYRDIGNTASTQLTNQLSSLTAPVTMDQKTLEQTPGYQFNLTQGQKGVTNSAAARGLGSSGAALKGAATFATGLADSTYQNQFNNAVTNQTNTFNRLSSLVNTGENAAAQTGAAGTSAANGASAAQIGAGNAQAAGYNAIGAAGTNAANSIGTGLVYKGLYGSGGTSGPSAGPITYGGPNGPVPFS